MKESAPWIRLVLAVLATWRVTHLLAHEDGPADIIVRFRARLGPGLAGKLMDCFYCLSLWVAAPAAFLMFRDPVGCLVSWLALSGAACLLEGLNSKPQVEDSEWNTSAGDMNYVLRTETLRTESRSGTGPECPIERTGGS